MMLRRTFTVIVLLGSLLTSAAHASLIVDLLTPGPISIGITLAKWLTQDSKKVLYVEVVAEGATLQQAREQAFRMAVERAVGTVIASETQVQDSRIVRDEVISYASGYVDRYELVEQVTVNGQVRVRMNIWVAHSRLANRLLNRSEAAGQVEGARITQQIHSIQNERQSADRLLESVLRDYPQRAYDVQLHQTEVRLDQQRQAHLIVPFTLSWNKNYVSSLAEAVSAINQRNDCSGMFARCLPRPMSVIQVPGVRAHFDDSRAFDLMHRHMLIDRPQVLIVIRGRDNAVRYRSCFSVKQLDQTDYSPWYFLDLGAGNVTVNSGRTHLVRAVVPLNNMSTDDLDRVEVTLTRIKNC
jgi:hypothetical protein